MRVVRGISLLVIMVGLFVIGCFAGAWGQRFFYPGNGAGDGGMDGVLAAPVPAPEKIQVAKQDENVINADTSFVVIEVDMDEQTETPSEIPVPAYFMGMDREDFEKQLDNFDRAPSLKEKQKGFQGSEIRSFSGSKVELYKYYQEKKEERAGRYSLAVSDNRVVVYRGDGETVYMETDIQAEDLPPDVLRELLTKGRAVETEEELYDFLESYSS